jgi:hypothetical protein
MIHHTIDTSIFKNALLLAICIFHTYALAWFAQFEIQTQKIEKLEFGQIGKLAKFIEI